jgi:hypothetical protein
LHDSDLVLVPFCNKGKWQIQHDGRGVRVAELTLTHGPDRILFPTPTTQHCESHSRIAGDDMRIRRRQGEGFSCMS